MFTSVGLGQTCLELKNSAVGENLNQMNSFSVPHPLSFDQSLKSSLFVAQDSKQLRPSITEHMSLPALG